MTSILGKAADNSFWKGVREEEGLSSLLQLILQQWEEGTKDGFRLKVHQYTDFKQFYESGNRSVYESDYFFYRKMLSASAVLSLVYPEKEEYFIYLQNLIYALCQEYTWVLPAHFSSKENIRPDFIDLFSAETGMYLAHIAVLFADRLDKCQISMIKNEVERRIILPYLHPTKHYWWEESDNNWAAVCGGSVGCTFMLLFPELFSQAETKLTHTIERFLSGFGDDGICVEGFSYWDYGFGFFVLYAEMLRTFTNGKTDYFRQPKVKAIASFAQKVFLSQDCTVSFSDGDSHSTSMPCLSYFLTREYPDTVEPSPKSESEISRFAHILRDFTWYSRDKKHTDLPLTQITWAKNAQWYLRKTPTYGFAAKGGTNGESHNHNDLGHFIIAKNGKQLLCDLGAASYCRQYFTEERYNFLACSSRGHSVPQINGLLQSDGCAFYAAADCAKNEEGDDTFSLQLKNAYPLSSLTSLKRTFTFRENSIILCDAYSSTEPISVKERFVTLLPPSVSGNKVELEGITLLFPQDGSLTVSSEQFEDHHHQIYPVYLIDFQINDSSSAFLLQIKL